MENSIKNIDKNEKKIAVFEYIIDELINWFSKVNNHSNHDFDKLKTFKLLFFVSVVNSKRDDLGLLELFDNYWAFPYGPVEKDVYSKLYNMKKYTFSDKMLTKIITLNHIPIEADMEIVEDKDKEMVKNSIEKLKNIDEFIINYPQFQLVEISHRWPSWRYFYKEGLNKSIFSHEIPSEALVHDNEVADTNTILQKERYLYVN